MISLSQQAKQVAEDSWAVRRRSWSWNWRLEQIRTPVEMSETTTDGG